MMAKDSEAIAAAKANIEEFLLKGGWWIEYNGSITRTDTLEVSVGTLLEYCQALEAQQRDECEAEGPSEACKEALICEIDHTLSYFEDEFPKEYYAQVWADPISDHAGGISPDDLFKIRTALQNASENDAAVRDFIKDYFEQDNCGTAYPIYFTIRDVEWQASYHFGEGDRHVFIWDTEELYDAPTMAELMQKIYDDEDFKNPEDFDPSDIFFDNACFEEWNDLNGNHGAVFSQNKCWTNKNMFFLKSEAEEHLKANHYHYSKEAHVYCEHAWRAPRQEAFFNTLSKTQAAAIARAGGDDE